MRAFFAFGLLLQLPLPGFSQASDSLPAQDASLDRAEGAVQPANQSGSLARVMDAFIRVYALETPAWRFDVTTKEASETSVPPEGFQKGCSDRGIWYHFRPKTADMLKIEERRAVMRDKRFPAFLAKMRVIADGGAPNVPAAVVAAAKKPASPPPPAAELGRAELLSRLLAGRRPPPEPISFDVSAEELMLPGRLLVTVDTSNLTP